MMHSLFVAVMVTQEAVDPSAIGGLLESVSAGTAAYGWLGGLAAALSGLVMAFRMLLPGGWDMLTPLAKRGLVFVLAGVGAGLFSWLGDVGVMPALSAGVMAGFAAMGVHQSAKALKLHRKRSIGISVQGR